MNRRALPLLAIAFAVLLPGRAAALDFPPFEEEVIDGGLRLVVIPDRSLPYLRVTLAVPVGSLQDPDGKEGTAEVTARLLRFGAAGLGEERLAERLDGLGAAFDATADVEQFRAEGDIPTLDRAARDAFVSLFLEMVARPALDPAALDKVRRLLRGQLESLTDNNAGIARRAATMWALRGHPYGRPASGTLESLAALSIDDVRAWHRRHLVPAHATLVFAGDIDLEAAEELVSEHPAFTAWVAATDDACASPAPPPGAAAGAAAWCKRFCLEGDCVPNRRLDVPAAPALAAEPPQTGPQILLLDKAEPGLNQEQFRVAFPLREPLGTDGWFRFRMAVQTLGGDFTARMNTVLRIQQGLTYGARIGFDVGTTFPGLATLSTYTKPKDVVRALDLAFAQMDDFVANGPKDEEHRGFQDKIINGRAFVFETVDGVVEQLLLVRLNGLDLDFVRRYEDRIRSVTPAASQAAAATVFAASRVRMVVVGNAADAPGLRAWAKARGGSLTVRPASAVLHAGGL